MLIDKIAELEAKLANVISAKYRDLGHLGHGILSAYFLFAYFMLPDHPLVFLFLGLSLEQFIHRVDRIVLDVLLRLFTLLSFDGLELVRLLLLLNFGSLFDSVFQVIKLSRCQLVLVGHGHFKRDDLVIITSLESL